MDQLRTYIDTLSPDQQVVFLFSISVLLAVPVTFALAYFAGACMARKKRNRK